MLRGWTTRSGRRYLGPRRKLCWDPRVPVGAAAAAARWRPQRTRSMSRSWKCSKKSWTNACSPPPLPPGHDTVPRVRKEVPISPRPGSWPPRTRVRAVQGTPELSAVRSGSRRRHRRCRQRAEPTRERQLRGLVPEQPAAPPEPPGALRPQAGRSRRRPPCSQTHRAGPASLRERPTTRYCSRCTQSNSGSPVALIPAARPGPPVPADRRIAQHTGPPSGRPPCRAAAGHPRQDGLQRRAIQFHTTGKNDGARIGDRRQSRSSSAKADPSARRGRVIIPAPPARRGRRCRRAGTVARLPRHA